MPNDEDRIELDVHVATTMDRAWSVVGQPGWFINSGALTHHEVEWQGQNHVTVTDPEHGTFAFEVGAVDPPGYAAYVGINADGNGANRLVEFRLTPADDGVDIAVAESGFASMNVSAEERAAQYEQNTKTWRQQLQLVREYLESPAAGE